MTSQALRWQKTIGVSECQLIKTGKTYPTHGRTKGSQLPIAEEESLSEE